jgi:hypothetical protein
MQQAGRSWVRFLLWPLNCFNSLNPYSLTKALGFAHPLSEMSNRYEYLLGVKPRPARKADNLTAICDPTVERMWESRRLTIPWAFNACYRDISFSCFHWKLRPCLLWTSIFNKNTRQRQIWAWHQDVLTDWLLVEKWLWRKFLMWRNFLINSF